MNFKICIAIIVCFSISCYSATDEKSQSPDAVENNQSSEHVENSQDSDVVEINQYSDPEENSQDSDAEENTQISDSGEKSQSREPETNCEKTKQDKWFFKYSQCKNQPTQVSLMVNISQEKVEGSQFSLITNVANKDVKNFQVAYAYNHVNNKIDGAQISLFANYARHVDGAQISSDINVAKRVDGLQLSGINIVDTISGVQIGAFNLARHIDGYSIGLLTISGNGLLHVDVSQEETGMSKLTFASGKTLFTSYSFGYTFDGVTNPYSFGMGFGYHKDFSRLYLETSLHGNLILDKRTKWSEIEDHDHKSDPDWRFNSLFQLKACMGIKLVRGIGVFGGVMYSGLKTRDNGELMHSWTNDYTKSKGDFYYWPGLEMGIRIGR